MDFTVYLSIVQGQFVNHYRDCNSHTQMYFFSSEQCKCVTQLSCLHFTLDTRVHSTDTAELS